MSKHPDKVTFEFTPREAFLVSAALTGRVRAHYNSERQNIRSGGSTATVRARRSGLMEEQASVLNDVAKRFSATAMPVILKNKVDR